MSENETVIGRRRNEDSLCRRKELRNQAGKGSREIILVLHLASSEIFFSFNERSWITFMLMGKI